ncbi:neuronal acetylcholine receptor subunit alpha-7-like isoform X1 [Lycorma delicatula]|uniref:neuronal acetylcholine receptor subunit alpha-7-like isoform X1 n=1 Tax=Lycorma delicatula TaxID=130591 RepID=UPI003F511C7A
MHYIIFSITLLLPMNNLCFSLRNGHEISEIRNALLRNYNKLESPVNTTSKLTIKLYLFISEVEMDYKEDDVFLGGELYMCWNDSRLKWNLSDHEDMTILSIPEGMLWKPSPSLVTTIHSTDVKVNDIALHLMDEILVTNNGFIIYNIKVKNLYSKNSCNDDINNWPRDVKQCSIKIGFPSYLNQNITFYPDYREYGYGRIRTTSWGFSDLSFSKLINDKTKEEELMINFKLHRSNQQIEAYFIVPSIVQLCIAMGVFWMDPRSPERTVIIGLLITTHCFNLQTMMTQVPYHGNVKTPFIMKLSVLSFLMIVLHLIITIILRKMITTSYNPSWISVVTTWTTRNPVIRRIFFLNMNPKIAAELLEEDEEGSLLLIETNKLQKQWQIIVQLVNYSIFILLIPIFVYLLIEFVKYL